MTDLVLYLNPRLSQSNSTLINPCKLNAFILEKTEPLVKGHAARHSGTQHTKKRPRTRVATPVRSDSFLYISVPIWLRNVNTKCIG